MKSRPGLLGVVLVISIAGAATGFAQTSNHVAEPKAVIIGVVEKIDPKGKTITVNHAIALVVTESESTSSDSSGRGRGGGGRGGRGRSEENSGGTAGRTPATPISGSNRTEYKVVVSAETILKEGESDIHLSDLKIGDQVEVTTKKDSSKVEAIEIIRVPKDSKQAP